jgi:hypothetical protein
MVLRYSSKVVVDPIHHLDVQTLRSDLKMHKDTSVWLFYPSICGGNRGKRNFQFIIAMEYYASQCTVPCYNLVGIPIRCKTVGETLRYKIIVASGSFILAVVEAFPLQISLHWYACSDYVDLEYWSQTATFGGFLMICKIWDQTWRFWKMLLASSLVHSFSMTMEVKEVPRSS